MIKRDLTARLKHIGWKLKDFAADAGLNVQTVYHWDDCPSWVDGYVRALEDKEDMKRYREMADRIIDLANAYTER